MYRRLDGAPGDLGAPVAASAVTPTSPAGTTGTMLECERGAIFRSHHGECAVTGPFFAYFTKAEGTAGRLGFPVAAAATTFQRFEGAVLFRTPQRKSALVGLRERVFGPEGAVAAVSPEVLAAVGGDPRQLGVGLPLGEAMTTDDATIQEFERARVVITAETVVVEPRQRGLLERYPDDRLLTAAATISRILFPPRDV